MSLLSFPGKLALRTLLLTTYAGFGFTSPKLPRTLASSPRASLSAIARLPLPHSEIAPSSSLEIAPNGRALINKGSLATNVDHHVLSIKSSTKKALLSRSQSADFSATTLNLVLDSGCTRHVHPH